jgi:hypothetical protein
VTGLLTARQVADMLAGGASVTKITLTPQSEAICERIAELVVNELERRKQRPESEGAAWVDATTAARMLGVKRGYIYRHKDELGAEPIGTGPKPRLRFDTERLRAARGSTAPKAAAPAPRPGRKGGGRRDRPVRLLPVAGEGEEA